MYTKHELRSFIKRFVADALWSEYSAQFDDANYPIDEDKFIKTAKTFVKPQLIHDIEDYDFAWFSLVFRKEVIIYVYAKYRTPRLRRWFR